MGCADLDLIQYDQSSIWWWVPLNITSDSLGAIGSMAFHVQRWQCCGICNVSPTCRMYDTLHCRAIDGHHTESDEPGVQST
jgi:hypothetical protein